MLKKPQTAYFACLLLASMNVEAVTNQWTSSRDGSWADPASWNLGKTPTASEQVWHANHGSTITVTTPAEANTLLVGHNNTSIIAVASGGNLMIGGGVEIGNAGSDGTGMLVVDGGSVSIGGDIEFGKFGTTRKGVGELRSGKVDVGGVTALGGFNAASGNLTINDGTYSATSGFFFVGRNGDGTLTINHGTLNLQTDTDLVWNPLRIGTMAGNGTVNIQGGEIYTGGIIMEGAEPDAGTATLQLFGGSLRVEGAFAAAIQVHDDARIVFDKGVFQWKGNLLSTIVDMVNGGYITFTNGRPGMLTERWEHSWTNGSSVLYADFNDANRGYTTVWALDTTLGE